MVWSLYSNELLLFHEFHAHRGSNIQHLPRRCQPARFVVDSQYHDVVGLLVCGEEKLASRIDLETARDLALGGSVFNRGEYAFAGVDGEHGDRVTSAVRGVEEFAGSVHLE